MNLLAWLQAQLAAYAANANAARDYRVQWRGLRAPLLFGGYLLVLITFASVFYAQTVAAPGVSLAEAQGRLHDFFLLVMSLLGAMIAFIAPALTATAVIMERQRRSFDLVFSAPVTPKYYLVGKLFSSFRTIWMLLVLSIPVTAASVLLGGASWLEVLLAYGLLSVQALAISAISLLISAVAPRAVSAVVWAYAAVGLGLVGSSSMMFSTGQGLTEAPFTVALSPFGVALAASTHTTVLGLAIPNAFIAALVCLLATKLSLTAAGAALSPGTSAERVSLRVHGLLYTAGLAVLVGHAFGGMTQAPGQAEILPMALAWLSLPLAGIMGYLTCFGYDAERRCWPNGLFNVGRMFDGTPAGGLPFLYALILAAACGLAGGGFLASGRVVGPEFLAYIAYTMGFWTFFWGIGRAMSLKGVVQGRLLQFVAFVTVIVIPVPFLAALGSQFGSHGDFLLRYLHPFAPAYNDSSSGWIHALVVAVLMGVSGAWIAARTERRLEGQKRVDLEEHDKAHLGGLVDCDDARRVPTVAPVLDVPGGPIAAQDDRDSAARQRVG